MNYNITVDGVTLEVMRNALQSVAEEMGATLIRTAFSVNIKDRRDCSSAIYTANGELVAQAEHIPLHLGLMPAVVKAILERFPKEDLEPGDAIMINDPYVSGSHLPDVCVCSPVFYDGELVALVANISHYSDFGGMAPGSMPITAHEIFQEGMRVNPVKIRKGGVVDEELIGLIANNVRVPREFRGDLDAQLACNNVGERRIKELIDKYGKEYVMVYMEEMLNYSERRIVNRIKNMENGEYEFEDILEIGPEKGQTIPIKVVVKILDDHMVVDFTGTGPQMKGSLNCTRAVVLACVFYCMKSMLDPEVPSNGGAFRPVEVITPKGTIVNPNFPAATSNANINTSHRIVDAIFGALGKALPERAQAACNGSQNLLIMGGNNPRNGKYFSYVETYAGGMGAVHNFDGMDGVHTHMTNTLNTPTEVIEMTFPLFVEEYGLRPDTEGAGEFRGGMGVVRKIKILGDSVTATITSDRSYTDAWGLEGGLPGAHSYVGLISPEGQEEKMPVRMTDEINKNETIVFKTPGAGGMGNPLVRKPSAVLHDVIEGLVSIERAKSVYGVVINLETLEVDQAATNELRSSLQETIS